MTQEELLQEIEREDLTDFVRMAFWLGVVVIIGCVWWAWITK
jgi:hypothetical protein